LTRRNRFYAVTKHHSGVARQRYKPPAKLPPITKWKAERDKLNADNKGLVLSIERLEMKPQQYRRF